MRGWGGGGGGGMVLDCFGRGVCGAGGGKRVPEVRPLSK